MSTEAAAERAGYARAIRHIFSAVSRQRVLGLSHKPKVLVEAASETRPPKRISGPRRHRSDSF
jgi:hypothetical protein